MVVEKTLADCVAVLNSGINENPSNRRWAGVAGLQDVEIVCVNVMRGQSTCTKSGVSRRSVGAPVRAETRIQVEGRRKTLIPMGRRKWFRESRGFSNIHNLT